MKNLNNLVEEKIKEFDDTFIGKFTIFDIEDGTATEKIRQFIHQSLTSIAKEALEAVRLEKKENNKEQGQHIDPFIDGQFNGWNKAVSEQKDKANKFLNN